LEKPKQALDSIVFSIEATLVARAKQQEIRQSKLWTPSSSQSPPRPPRIEIPGWYGKSVRNRLGQFRNLEIWAKQSVFNGLSVAA